MEKEDIGGDREMKVRLFGGHKKQIDCWFMGVRVGFLARKIAFGTSVKLYGIEIGCGPIGFLFGFAVNDLAGSIE